MSKDLKLKYEFKIDKWIKGATQALVKDTLVRNRVQRACDIVRNEAINGIQGQPKSGRTYTRRSVTHQASAPGEYPATDLGGLVQGITTEVDRQMDGSVVGKIISSAPYSKALEYGTRNMEARPFMAPSLAKSRRRINNIFKEGIVKPKYKKRK